MDREFKKINLTARQWLCIVAIERLREKAPGDQNQASASLGKLADALSCSHQNAKQIVISLEKKGFVTMEKAANDKRTLQIRLTDYCREFWKEREATDSKLLTQLFAPLASTELSLFTQTLIALDAHTKTLQTLPEFLPEFQKEIYYADTHS